MSQLVSENIPKVDLNKIVQYIISNVKSFSIFYSQDKSENIKKLLKVIKDKGYSNENELEIRFQSVEYNQFEKIKNTIEKDKLFINKENIKTNVDILTNDTGVGDNIRRETNINNKTTIYQIKENIYNFHFDLEKSKIKFSFSKEINVNANIVGTNEIILKRYKDRTRYNFGIFTIDLTIVETQDIKKNKKFKTYEVEIEFDLFYEKQLYEHIYISLVYILKILYPEKLSYLDNEYENKSRETYRKIFTRTDGQFPQRFGTNVSYQFNNKPANFILENKPKNFKLENIDTFNHSITNKLNGVNFFLFYSYDRNSLCLINHSTIDILGKDIKGELGGNIVIQGEVFDNNGKKIFYIFDVLMINNNSVMELNHKERCNSFLPLLDYFNDCINIQNGKKLNIEFKKFYGFLPSENNFYENLINCKNSLKIDKNNNIDMEINDGFIFTPLNKPYINNETYKYKFPETMTIDFLVKPKRTVSVNSKYFDLYVYNEQKNLIEFNHKYKKFYMKCEPSDILFNEIQLNSIVECKYNKINDFFTPYRIRYDKILPNFYRVANDVFNDILNPITIDILEELFKKKFYKENVQDTSDIVKSYIKSPHIQIKKISVKHTLQIDLKDILECVLYSVSPEYRNINSEYNKSEIYKSAISYFKKGSDILSDETSNLTLLSKNFNIKIYILKSIVQDEERIALLSPRGMSRILDESLTDNYEILKESENVSDNILYIVQDINSISILGYKVGKYEVFIF